MIAKHSVYAVCTFGILLASTSLVSSREEAGAILPALRCANTGTLPPAESNSCEQRKDRIFLIFAELRKSKVEIYFNPKELNANKPRQKVNEIRSSNIPELKPMRKGRGSQAGGGDADLRVRVGAEPPVTMRPGNFGPYRRLR